MSRKSITFVSLFVFACGSMIAARSVRDQLIFHSNANASATTAITQACEPWEIDRGVDTYNPDLTNVPPEVQVDVFEPQSGRWIQTRRADVRPGQQFYISDCLCKQGSATQLIEIFPGLDRHELDAVYSPGLHYRPSRRPRSDEFVFVLADDSLQSGFRPLASLNDGEKFRFRGRIYSAGSGSKPHTLLIKDSGQLVPAFGDWLDAQNRIETYLELDFSEGKGEFVEHLIIPADDVAMLANGQSKRMADLIQGDLVETSDGLIGVVTHAKQHVPEPEPLDRAPPPPGLSYERIVGWVKHTTDTLLYLRTTNELVKTTPEHPFSVLGKGWVNAGELQKGDRIETLDQKEVEVVSTEIRHERETVYNLRVEGSNTFYVGEDMLLVHNGGPCVPEIKRLNPPIHIEPKGLKHVVDRHSVNQLPKFKGKSRFNSNENIESLISSGVGQKMIPQTNGRYARTFDVGRLIGFDRNTNAQTNLMTIITELDGRLVTAFPGAP